MLEKASPSLKHILARAWAALPVNSLGTCSLIYPAERDKRTKKISPQQHKSKDLFSFLSSGSFELVLDTVMRDQLWERGKDM